MSGPPLESLLVPSGADLRSALTAIDRNAQGIVFVCDAERHLLGVLSDGDARRAIVKGAPLSTAVLEVMNSAPTSRPVTADPGEVLPLLGRERGSGGLTHVPLVDEVGRVVDYASAHRLHRIQIAAPELTGNELAYVVDCVRTEWISSQGEYVREFVRQLSDCWACRIVWR